MTTKSPKISLICANTLRRAQTALQIIEHGLECHAYTDLVSFINDIGIGQTYTNVVMVADHQYSLDALAILGETNAKLGVIRHVYVLGSKSGLSEEFRALDNVILVEEISQIVDRCTQKADDLPNWQSRSTSNKPLFKINNGKAAKLLTAREREVMCFIASGYSNKETGRHLEISHRTVEVHRSSACSKLDVRNSVEAALFLAQSIS